VTMQEQQVQFGTRAISFTTHYADRRSMGIQVHPDGTVHVIAPNDTHSSEILKKVKTKAGWILKQQDHFTSFLPLTPPRKYLNGETHLYLGRQYRLKKMESISNQIKVYRGYIEVHCKQDTPEQINVILQDWYKSKAKIIFNELFTETLQKNHRFHNKKVTLHTKVMPTRWGSCSPSGRITLNTELVKSPKACIEYVIIHELCHLIYPKHNKRFYSLLNSIMPDWEKWKARLEKSMV